MRTPSNARPRLLLVDDDELFLDDVALLLDRDFDCVCETDPEAVVASVEQSKPDAVLLDLDFDGVMAKYVKITITAGHGIAPQQGLSELRFSYIPVWARQPNPVSGAADLAVDTILSFMQHLVAEY